MASLTFDDPFMGRAEKRKKEKDAEPEPGGDKDFLKVTRLGLELRRVSTPGFKSQSHHFLGNPYLRLSVPHPPQNLKSYKTEKGKHDSVLEQNETMAAGRKYIVNQHIDRLKTRNDIL